MNNTQIELYDTTLRDGMQGEGMSLSADEKLRLAHKLDDLGIDVIEAGFPSSNPKELELFDLLAREQFKTAQIAAFGMTRRKGTAASEDAALKVLAECFAPVATIVGKTWSLHLEKVVQVDRAENLAMIGESVEFLDAAGKRVIYDAEHFFDAFEDDREYALECLRVAASAGASTLALCDTNGATLPGGIAVATAEVVAALPDMQIAIHCHNDAELAVARRLRQQLLGLEPLPGRVAVIVQRVQRHVGCRVVQKLQRTVQGPQAVRLAESLQVARLEGVGQVGPCQIGRAHV